MSVILWEMQQLTGEQKVSKPDWYVQVDNSSEEVQVNRNSGLETYGQEFDTTNGGGGANVQTNEIK